MAGPYDPPAAPIDLESSPSKIRRYRTTSVVLAVMAVLTGWIYLPPFLTSSFRAWGWQNWTFGFAPASYLLATALIGICPVAWYYLVVASIRWMAVFRFSSTVANRRIAAERAQS